MATVGTTSTTSIDPVAGDRRPLRGARDLAARRRRLRGLGRGGARSYAGVLAGCERADSLVVNPHKWLFTPVDCSVLYTRARSLRAAFSLVPEYLRTREDESPNLMDYGVQLGRRFRSLKLWMVLRAYGAGRPAAIVAGEHVELARRLEAAVRRRARLGAARAGAVLDRLLPHRPDGVDDEAELADATRPSWARERERPGALSHTQLKGRYALRVAIGNAATTAEHVDRAWDLLREAATA